MSSKHAIVPIDLYTWSTPNGRKVSIMLEECGLEYTVHPINIGKDEQFDPEFLAIAPNNRIPAIVDADGPEGPISIFESGAILVYLAEKTGMFLPAKGTARVKVMEWVFWRMGGVGPMFGQMNHFNNKAPEKIPYAMKRYNEESVRLLNVMDRQLAGHPYLGGEYSIADMITFPWIVAGLTRLADAGYTPDVPHVRRWMEEIGERPAVVRGMAIPTEEQVANAAARRAAGRKVG